MDNGKTWPTNRREAIHSGIAFYFTGKACKQGHVARRETLGGGCEDCLRENKQAHRQRARAIYHEARAARLAAESQDGAS